MRLFACRPALHRFDRAEEFFESFRVGEGDLILTMGAGDIYRVGEMILEMDK